MPSEYPDRFGYYGRFGGNHYPDHLKSHLAVLADTYLQIRQDADFNQELQQVQRTLQGRPTSVHSLRNLSRQLGGAEILVKREDLNHTGAPKINHCVGFALLARRLGKRKLIAETGAGQHGVAVATAAAYFGLECEVHMGQVDLEKASSSVGRMRVLGARIVAVRSIQGALTEASDSAFEAYAEQHSSALYAIGSAIGLHPFPLIARDFSRSSAARLERSSRN